MGFLESIKQSLFQTEDDKDAKVKTYNREFVVVGTKYNNDDNTSRQKILRDISKRKKPFNRKLDVGIESYDYKGEFALRVVVNGRMIGNIARKDLPFFQKNGDRIIGFKDLYVWGENELFAKVKVIVKSLN